MTDLRKDQSETLLPKINPVEERLSRGSFSDPQEFLEILREVLPKANPNHPDNVSRADLLNFAAHADLSGERAAATLGAAHIDELRQMATVFKGDYDPASGTGLSTRELLVDDLVVSGRTEDLVLDHMSRNLSHIGKDVLPALGLTVVGIVAAEAPPVSVGAFVLAGGFAFDATAAAVDEFTIGGRVAAATRKDAPIVQSWLQQGR